MIKSSDIVLRSWQDGDAEALYEMCLDPTLRDNGIRFYGSVRESLEAIRLWKSTDGFKVMTDKENHLFIGFISVSDMNRYDGYMEMEYAVAAEYRNKGYGTEAVRLMLEYGFTAMNLQVIAAWVRSHNLGSARVLEKCSFTLDGRLRRHARDGSDTLCYSILKEEWERKQNDT